MRINRTNGGRESKQGLDKGPGKEPASCFRRDCESESAGLDEGDATDEPADEEGE